MSTPGDLKTFAITNTLRSCQLFTGLAQPDLQNIADVTVVMRFFPAVQLQHQPAIVNKSLIVRTAVGTLTF